MKYAVFFLLILNSCLGYATGKQPLRPDFTRSNYAFSFAAGGVASFFRLDTRISEQASPLTGGSAMLRMHFFPSSSVHIHAGIEFMSQGAKFNTYYFAPGYSTLFDSSYIYTHKLRTVEMYIPLMIRIGVKNNEENAPALFYFLAGWSPKLLFGGSSSVTERGSGKSVWKGATNIEFENWFIGPQTGNVLLAGIGLDKRIKYSENFISLELIYRYNLSRIRYVGNVDTNNLLIKNSCLTVQIGYRFEGGRARRGY